MKNEIWKEIPNYENYYEINNYGVIRNKKNNKVLKQTKTNSGYFHVILSKKNIQKTFNVHKLVMVSFYGQKNLVIDHIDGNKENNNLSNLEYVTQKENCIRARKLGLIKKQENMINQYDLLGNYIKTWINASEIEKKLGINHSNIIKCCRNKRKTCNNYKWAYK